MHESYKPVESHEQGPVSEASVIEALDTHGVEHQETKELLARYAQQCEEEANAEASRNPGDKQASNRANIQCGLKMARVYAGTQNYKMEAAESLEELLDAAENDEGTADLAQEIREILGEL